MMKLIRQILFLLFFLLLSVILLTEAFLERRVYALQASASTLSELTKKVIPQPDTRGVFERQIVALAYNSEHYLLAVGTSSGKIRIYNTETTEFEQEIQTKVSLATWQGVWGSEEKYLHSRGNIAISPDGNLLAIVGADGTIGM
jgi:WD40 repeat protein